MRNPLTTSDSPYIGDHIKAKRTALGLLQEDVAKILKVSTDTITYWENHRSGPRIKFMPGIIEFLGYDPFPIAPKTFGDMIRRYRRLNGVSYKELGELLGVNQTTIRAWELNQSAPKGKMKIKLEHIMGAT